MPSLNRVQLIGYLGRDPDTKFTPSGKKVCHFNIAVTQRTRSGGEAKEYTDWFHIESWERLGEVAQQYLKKGSLVYVEGRLKTDKYEDKGETKYVTKVVASNLQFLDKKPTEEADIAVEEDAAGYEA